MSDENLPEIVSSDEWLAARTELLTREKEAVRAKDGLNTRRRQPKGRADTSRGPIPDFT